METTLCAISNEDVLSYFALEETKSYLENIYNGVIASERHDIVFSMFAKGRWDFGIFTRIFRLASSEFLPNTNDIDTQLWRLLLKFFSERLDISRMRGVAHDTDKITLDVENAIHKYVFHVFVPEGIIKYLQESQNWTRDKAESYYVNAEPRVTQKELTDFDEEIVLEQKKERQRLLKQKEEKRKALEKSNLSASNMSLLNSGLTDNDLSGLDLPDIDTMPEGNKEDDEKITSSQKLEINDETNKKSAREDTPIDNIMFQFVSTGTNNKDASLTLGKGRFGGSIAKINPSYEEKDENQILDMCLERIGKVNPSCEEKYENQIINITSNKDQQSNSRTIIDSKHRNACESGIDALQSNRQNSNPDTIQQHKNKDQGVSGYHSDSSKENIPFLQRNLPKRFRISGKKGKTTSKRTSYETHNRSAKSKPAIHSQDAKRMRKCASEVSTYNIQTEHIEMSRSQLKRNPKSQDRSSSTDSSFEYGDIVWAYWDRHWYAAQIYSPAYVPMHYKAELAKMYSHSRDYHIVCFYVDGTMSKVHKSQIESLGKSNTDKNRKKQDPKGYKTAINALKI